MATLNDKKEISLSKASTRNGVTALIRKQNQDRVKTAPGNKTLRRKMISYSAEKETKHP